jgi:hypothetical protein
MIAYFAVRYASLLFHNSSSGPTLRLFALVSCRVYITDTDEEGSVGRQHETRQGGHIHADGLPCSVVLRITADACH